MPPRDMGSPLEAALSYYSSIVVMTAEGDSVVSEDTLEGLGTTGFLLQALFGSILKLAQPSPAEQSSYIPPSALNLPLSSAPSPSSSPSASSPSQPPGVPAGPTVMSTASAAATAAAAAGWLGWPSPSVSTASGPILLHLLVQLKLGPSGPAA